MITLNFDDFFSSSSFDLNVVVVVVYEHVILNCFFSLVFHFILANIARNHSLYNLSGHGQYSHSVLSDLTQQLQWYVFFFFRFSLSEFNIFISIFFSYCSLFNRPNPAMYQLQSAAFRSPYPLSSVPSATFPGFAVRTPPIMPPHPASLSGHHHHHPHHPHHPTFPPHPSFLPTSMFCFV